MIKKGAALLSTEEAAFALRQALGNISAWHKTLECMRNDQYAFMGLRLLPATRINDGYGWRPYYDAADLRKFILDVRGKCGLAVAGKPVSSKRGDYDPNVSWKVQKTKPMARMIRGIRAAAIGLGVSAMMVSPGHAGKTDEPKTTYVGDGRWACAGNSAQCAQVEANNRQREQQRQYESDRQRYEADRYIQENRRREQENRNRY